MENFNLNCLFDLIVLCCFFQWWTTRLNQPYPLWICEALLFKNTVLLCSACLFPSPTLPLTTLNMPWINIPFNLSISVHLYCIWLFFFYMNAKHIIVLETLLLVNLNKQIYENCNWYNEMIKIKEMERCSVLKRRRQTGSFIHVKNPIIFH